MTCYEKTVLLKKKKIIQIASEAYKVTLVKNGLPNNNFIL